MVDITAQLDRNEKAVQRPGTDDGYWCCILNDDDVPVPASFREHCHWWADNVETRCRIGADEFPSIKDTSVLTTFIGHNGCNWETWIRKWNIPKPPDDVHSEPEDFDDFIWWTPTKEKAIESHRNALALVLLVY